METLAPLLAHAADLLLVLASLGAAGFCLVLARRLNRLSSIDNGLGGAIAVLSAQVDDMNKVLSEMKEGTSSSAERLEELNRDARQLTEELELMLAACHDIGQTAATVPAEQDESEAMPEPVFGSRRHRAAEEQDGADTDKVTIPFFLKNRSRMAGAG